jgi:signal transduction histidine kinase
VLHADRQRIAQVLANLAGNAAKFSPVGSTISVNAGVDQNHLRVDVADQGVGIPPEKRETIFETFVQLETQQFTGRRGLGIGLSLCKGVIEAHGGSIWVGHKDDPGTVISFTLPLTPTP